MKICFYYGGIKNDNLFPYYQKTQMTIQFTNKAHKDGFDKKSNLLLHKMQRIEHYHSTLLCLNLSAEVSLHSFSSLFSLGEKYIFVFLTQFG